MPACSRATLGYGLNADGVGWASFVVVLNLLRPSGQEYTVPVIEPSAFVEDMQERNLFPGERNRVVVACSGGPDSLLLLYLLWSCREPLSLDLSVLTCDHGLRLENAAEVLDVQQRAWSLGLPCATRTLNVPASIQAGESVEMAARRLRRDAYAEVAEQFGADLVALGHHQDDQAETILLRLCRGTGTRGAGGMHERSPLKGSIQLIRPLLGYRRQEIEETLRSWGLKGVQDPSNASRDFTRNRIRLDIVPALEEINPGVVDHLAAFAEDQRRLEAWVAEETAERSAGCLDGNGLRLEPWRFLPEVLQERALLGWFRDQGGQPEEVTRATWKALWAALKRPATHSRRWILGGVTLCAEGDVLSVGVPTPDAPQLIPADTACLECEAIGRRLRVDRVSDIDLGAANRRDLEGPLTAFVELPKDGFELRAPRPGDRYRPMGLEGRAKVSDLMINEKVPARLRPVWPVITSGDEIVWIPGFRVADPWQVTHTPCLRMTLEPGPTHTFCG